MGLRLGVELTAWHKHYGKLNIIAVEKKLMRLCPNCGYIPFPIRTTQLLGYTECFPTYFILLAPGYEENGGGAYHYSTWVGISGDKFHGRFDGADFSMVDNPWQDQHIRQNHGSLGELHPQTKYLLEGDTPTLSLFNPQWSRGSGKVKLW